MNNQQQLNQLLHDVQNLPPPIILGNTAQERHVTAMRRRQSNTYTQAVNPVIQNLAGSLVQVNANAVQLHNQLVAANVGTQHATVAMNAAVANEQTAIQRAAAAEALTNTAMEVIVELSKKCADGDTALHVAVENLQDDVNDLFDKKKTSWLVFAINVIASIVSLVLSCFGAFAPTNDRRYYYATIALSITLAVLSIVGIIISRE